VDSVQNLVAAADEDTTPPTIEITDPTSFFSFQLKPKIDVRGISDDNIEVVQVTWESDQGESGTAEGTENWFISNLRLRRGFNKITVTAHDAAGNSQSDTILVFSGLWR
jgi:hypothetical protein